ncbi:MAG TPA: DUF2290 domain-containing protein [Ilumatobacter sp.]|nr:DUF2290 domain-containing protein [Ilumatobacter sp.]
MTIRALHDEVTNVLDYLLESELALFVNKISMKQGRVSWHAYDSRVPFLQTNQHHTLAQFSQWVAAGHYSCILFDGSLLQLTYDMIGSEVSGHRLAYIPCPMVVDLELLRDEPLADVMEMYSDDVSSFALRTPIRFDFDPSAAKQGHPAAHMTLNSIDCRIACVAPMHVGRFVDFVFRNFYPDLRAAHAPFFVELERRHLGERVIEDDERHVPYMAWNLGTNYFGGVAHTKSGS